MKISDARAKANACSKRTRRERFLRGRFGRAPDVRREVRRPLRIDTADGHDDPHRLVRGTRCRAEMEPGLVRKPVLLTRIAALASGDDVVPGVGTAAAPRDHVIDVLRRRSAVLAD